MNKRIVDQVVVGVFPCPYIILTSAARGRVNAMALGNAANVSGAPPMVAIAVHPANYTHELIEESGEFVINIPGPEQLGLFFKMGSASGKTVDKLSVNHVEWHEGSKVKAPVIDNCPINLECRVNRQLTTGNHTLFIATIELMLRDSAWLDREGSVIYSKVDTATGKMVWI